MMVTGMTVDLHLFFNLRDGPGRCQIENSPSGAGQFDGLKGTGSAGGGKHPLWGGTWRSGCPGPEGPYPLVVHVARLTPGRPRPFKALPAKEMLSQPV